jgi:hypothetical protein
VKDLISSSARSQFPQLMTDSTASIGAAFHDAGFACPSSFRNYSPNPDCTNDDSNVRRSHAHAFLEIVDLSASSHVDRACRAFVHWRPKYDRVMFTGLTRFRRARFTGDLILGDARFSGEADFRKAVFEGRVSFADVTAAKGSACMVPVRSLAGIVFGHEVDHSPDFHRRW